MTTYGTQVTAYYLAAVAAYEAGGAALNIAGGTLVVGDGAGAVPPISSLIAANGVTHEVWRGTTISSVAIDSANPLQLDIGCVIPAAAGGVEVGPFVVTEFAILDALGNCCVVGTLPSLPKVTSGAGMTSDLAWMAGVTIGIGAVTVTPPSTGFATMTQVITGVNANLVSVAAPITKIDTTNALGWINRTIGISPSALILHGTDTGTGTAVAVSSVTPTATTFTTGQLFLVTKSATGISGASTATILGVTGPLEWADATATATGAWPASSPALLMWDGAAYRILSVMGPSVFGAVATSALTFYVNASSGNDSNSGLSSGSAFATIQKAINVASTIRTINTQINISVADGSYASFTFANVVGCSIALVGDMANPANCIITTGGSGTFACNITGQASISISGFKFNGIGGAIRADKLSLVTVANCIFNISGNQVDAAYGLYALGSSVITATGPLTVANASAAFIVAGQRSTIAVDNQTLTSSSASFTLLSGTPGYYAWANGGAITASNITIAGTVSYGQRLEVDSGGAVYTGSGASGALIYFPGTIAAVVATGCYAG